MDVCLIVVYYEVRGSIRLVTEDTGCTIRTGANRPSTSDYVVRGEIFEASRGKVPIHLGLPRIHLLDQDGVPRRVESADLEWRPRGRGNTWKPLSHACLGAVTIRHCVEGDTLYREHFRILPSTSSFEMVDAEMTDSGATHFGAWQFEGTKAVLVDGTSTGSLSLQVDELDEDFWRVTASARAPTPSTIELSLLWENDCQLSLDLAFPARVVRFVFPDDTDLASGQSIPWQMLGHVRAQAISPTRDSTFVVVGNLSGSDVSRALGAELTLESQLHELSPHSCELELGELQRQVELLFASTKDLDAVLRLRISPKFGVGTYVQRDLLVTRFGGAITRQNESLARQDLAESGITLDVNARLLTKGVFSIRDGSGRALRLEKASKHRMEAVALWNPSRRVELGRSGDSFTLDEKLEDGDGS